MRAAWFAIRTRPSYQHMASVDDQLPPQRHHEFVIERQCRERGYDIFTPSFWAAVVHHRKKTVLTKRFPLFVGYSFVQLPALDFERLRNRCDGVLCVLRDSRGPVVFGEETITRLAFADWQERQDMLFAAHEKAELARFNEINKIRHKLKLIMPKGRAMRVNIVEQAEKKIDSLPPKTKAFAQDLLKRLHELTGDGLENVLEPV